MRLIFVRLLVEDYVACFRFYRDVMGFPVTYGSEDGGYADFDAGSDTQIAIFVRRSQMDQIGGVVSASGDKSALILQVDDVDRSLAELRDRGASVASKPADREDWGIRVARIRDPDGNLIELNHALPPS